jgi:anti-anti-sigma factor
MVFEIGTSFTPPLAVLRLRGELDLNTVNAIGWAIDEALDQGCALVGMDLAGVSFIDCSGIGALIEAMHRLNAASAQLCVHRLSREVSRMMKLTATDVLFGVCDLAPARN